MLSWNENHISFSTRTMIFIKFDMPIALLILTNAKLFEFCLSQTRISTLNVIIIIIKHIQIKVENNHISLSIDASVFLCRCRRYHMWISNTVDPLVSVAVCIFNCLVGIEWNKIDKKKSSKMMKKNHLKITIFVFGAIIICVS